MDYSGVLLLEVNDEQISDFYTNPADNSKIQARENQYIIFNSNKELIGPYKWANGSFSQVKYPVFSSSLFGQIKPKNNDKYQICYMDSLINNQLTAATGAAGTGKSLLALAYAFQGLQKGTISKIYVFCNTYAAKGAAKLGYYPGTRDDKLLDSQIGMILSSKFGGKMLIDQFIQKNELELIPMSDVRGFETMENSFAYFTEAQNLDIYLMKLFLQRLSDTTKVVVEGDFRQVDDDCFSNGRNGLRRMIDIFGGKSYFGHIPLQSIYRSQIAKDAEDM